MTLIEKFLGQKRPRKAKTVVLYTQPEGKRAIVKHLQIANEGLAKTTVWVFLDNTGKKTSKTVQLITKVPAFGSKSFPVFWVIDGGGSLLVRVGNPGGTTVVTAYGAEIDAPPQGDL